MVSRLNYSSLNWTHIAYEGEYRQATHNDDDETWFTLDQSVLDGNDKLKL